MKSFTNRVGTMEEDGMWKGSATNERSSKTINNTGKKERAYSTSSGSRREGFSCGGSSARALRLANQAVSSNQIRPLSSVARVKMASKSKFMMIVPNGP